jgi:homoserine/homoserine lactone efflux protein
VNIETTAAFTTVAAISILSPGPAVLLTLRNGIGYGVRSVIWSGLGNICGIFCLSATAMFGLGVVLKSSALFFGALKVVGALYLLYVGILHLIGRATLAAPVRDPVDLTSPAPGRLWREAFFLAATNPKPILFFSALFPQFIIPHESLVPQFFVLTGIFMALSFLIHLGYAALGARARSFLIRPRFVKWLNRVVGSIFISFGVALLALRRPAT